MSTTNFQSVSSTDADSRNSVKVYDTKNCLLYTNIYQKSKYVLKDVLNTVGGVLIISYLIWTPQCMLKEEIGRSHLTSALFAGAGISYILFEIISRKLIINGGCRFGYVVCILILLEQEREKCPGTGDIFAMGEHRRAQEWQFRLQIVQGAVIVTCIAQMLIGSIGVSQLARFIRPVSIAPIMLLISISVVRTTAVRMADSCWILFFGTTILMFLSYSSYYYFRAKNNDESCNKLLNIRRNLYIGVTSVLIMWILCILLSSMDYVESESPARADIYTGAFNHSTSLRLSYFFQWGKPKWELDAILLLLPACFISVCEILASYYEHRFEAERRGRDPTREKRDDATWSSIIGWEAAFCLLNVTMGTALGIAIDFKKRNQEYVGFFVGIILVSIALSGKLCSLFVIIPEPIVSALIFLSFLSMFFEGLNVTRCIDFASRKNLYIVGSALFLGFVIPALIKDKSLHITGRPISDCVCTGLLSIDFLVAGTTAIILDNLTRAFAPKKLVLPTRERPQPVDQKKDLKKPMHFCDCFVPFFV